jgi:histidinol dehydrogenase
VRRRDWSALDPAARRALLRRPARARGAGIAGQVARLLARVRREGDSAVRELTARFDGVAPGDFEVTADELAASERALPPRLRAALDEAAGRIRAFHAAGMAPPLRLATAPGVVCERMTRPIARVGLYVPAGSAPLPSTALMLAVPAALAGCPEIVLCTPPRPDGSADPAVLAVARRFPGIRVFRLGGVQAIGAMAFGTESVPRCDKLFGPGNAWVAEAKRQVAARPDGPAIDLPAGPSELLVIADDGARPDFVAADLLSQAEHGADSQVVLLSDSARLIGRVAAELRRQLSSLPRAAIARRALASAPLIRVDALVEAFAISNAYAPEHLSLALREPRAWLMEVRCAGSVFLGDFTPESLGDYASGTNHVLPTGGAARAAGGLSVASFQVAITVQEALPAGLAAIGPCAMELARAEGLEAHRRAVATRLGGVA